MKRSCLCLPIGLLAFLIILLFSHASFGQLEKTVKKVSRIDSASHVRPWDVSMSLYGLIKGAPMRLTIRRMSKKNGAYRLSLWGGISKDRSYGMNSDSLISKAKHWHIGTTLGYEWQKNIKKHQLYYGVEAFYSYASDASGSVVNPYHESRIHIGLVGPFIGAKYRILPQLSVSVEIWANFSFHQLSNWDHVENRSEGFSRTIGVGLDPFRALNLSYHF
ncbi:hypothetical protein SAMN05216327_103257 [Dyadobacter sp. SG02]|uniref:hypothetical protein n=1 Tax=Dyadobacter sp. SG02 TaxID=1855291 RepID=UPI0008B39193|nr:hypothetical protein [Dyadobacter sp. SG02]SEI68849.1 hypothetical protein SAMN05216327_103257 [Dyadobacter sp. SG02]